MNDNIKFRKMSINDRDTPDISITPTKDGRFNLFGEKSGLTIGTFSKKYLIAHKSFSVYQLDNIKGTTNFKALKKVKVNPNKPKVIKWGFDLTGFDSARQFEALLIRNGFDPVKSFKRLHPYKEHPDVSHFQWKHKYLKIVTGNNPITGEYNQPSMRKPEKGYASYIGIEGNTAYVEKLVKDIKRTTRDIKDESKYTRDFI